MSEGVVLEVGDESGQVCDGAMRRVLAIHWIFLRQSGAGTGKSVAG